MHEQLDVSIPITHSCMHVLTKGLFDMLTYPQPTRDFCGGAASAKPPLQSLSLAMAPRAGLLGDFAMPNGAHAYLTSIHAC